MKIAQQPRNLEARHAVKLVASLCLGVFPSAALHAQSATAELADVMVQSGRLEQKQFDAPASVFAIDADTIRGSGPQVNLSDVLSQVPGVVALNRNNYAQDVQISIRGFGARSAFGVRGIRIITDGIPATIPDGQGQTSTVSMTSTERIEVLTGPLAQLYGNSSGGVIQTFTREAGDQPEARAQVMMGSFGMTRTDWQFSQKTGNVGLVADYSTFGIDGYRQNSDTRRQQLNSVITVDAQPDTKFKFIVNVLDMPYAKDPVGLTASQASATPQIAGNLSSENGAQKTVKHEQVGMVVDHKLDGDLRFQGRLYSGMRDTLQYQAGSVIPASPAPYKATWVGLSRHFDGFGLQLKGKGLLTQSQPFDWVIGFDKDHSGEQRQGGATQSGAKNGALTRNEMNEANNSDYYGQVNWHLGERWTLTTGARSSEVTLNSQNNLSGGSNTGQATYKATSPVLGLTWHAQDNLNLYVNQGKGFETPTLSETAYTNAANPSAGGFNLQASKSEHFEVGGKWLPSPTSRIDLAWFRIKTDNEIAVDVAGPPASYKNVGKTLREGVELSNRNLLNANWRTVASVNVIKATYEDGFNGLAGKNLPGIPAKQLFTSLQWSEKGFASNGKKPALGTEMSIDWMARSKIWATDQNTPGTEAPGYGVLNARARQRYQIGSARVEAYVGIDNLTNRDTIGSVIINQNKTQYFEPGLPRSWVLGLQSQIPL